MGISRDDIEGMQVRIGSNGDVSVDGIEDEGVREQVQKLIDEKYGDRMYQYYIGIADSVGNLPGSAYQYATDVQEVRHYLKEVTGEDILINEIGTVVEKYQMMNEGGKERNLSIISAPVDI